MRDILHFLPSTLPNTVGRDDKKSCFDQSHQICHRKQGTKLSFRHSSTLWQMIDNLAPSVTKGQEQHVLQYPDYWQSSMVFSFVYSGRQINSSDVRGKCRSPPKLALLLFYRASSITYFGLGQGLFRSFELEIIFSTFGNPELEM